METEEVSSLSLSLELRRSSDPNYVQVWLSTDYMVTWLPE
jgi:hypothetical protein